VQPEVGSCRLMLQMCSTGTVLEKKGGGDVPVELSGIFQGERNGTPRLECAIRELYVAIDYMPMETLGILNTLAFVITN